MEANEKDEKKDAKAISEEEVSVEQATDLDIPKHKQKMLQNSSNVSNEDLKAARLASLSNESVKSDEKVAEKKDVTKVEKNDEQVNSESSEDSNLDDILKDIVKEEETKKEFPEKKEDRPQHNIDGEWKRKYEELRSEIEEIKKEKPQIKAYSPEWYESLSNELNADPEDIKRTVTLLERGYQTGIAPQIKVLEDEIKQLKSKEFAKDVKSKAEKDELYSIVKDDYQTFYEEFSKKDLPDEVVADYAMAKAKEKNYPKLIKAVQKHEKVKAKESRRVIPSEESSVSYSRLNVSSKLPQLTTEDKEVMRKLGYTKKDVENFGNNKKGFIEK